MHNRGTYKNNSSGVKGVNFEKIVKKWRANIMIDGTQITLGFFKTLEEAKLARINKANELFGEYINACEKS